MRRVRFSFLGLLAAAALAAACNSILDFGQFEINPTDGGTSNNGDGGGTDAGDGGNNGNREAGVDGSASCNVDLTQACYPAACTPSTTDQYLNSCNGQNETCSPFDNSRVSAFLVDGGLPKIPEGGVP